MQAAVGSSQDWQTPSYVLLRLRNICIYLFIFGVYFEQNLQFRRMSYVKFPTKLRTFRIYVEGNAYIILLLQQDNHFRERIFYLAVTFEVTVQVDVTLGKCKLN